MKQNKQTWGRQEVAQAEAILAAVTEAISIESSERAAVVFRIIPCICKSCHRGSEPNVP